MRALMLATFCAATLNAFRASAEFSTPWMIQTETITIHVNLNFFRPRTRILIELALLVGAIALWLRTKKGFVVSALALACVELAYLNWLFRTYRGVKNAEALSYAKIQHLAYLGGANWLDVFVWVACTIILLWVLVALTGGSVDWREETSLA